MGKKKFRTVAAFALALVLLGILGAQLLFFPTIRYDTGDPDYDWIADRLEAARQDSDAERKLDFALLSKGDWETACLFGGYTDPQELVIEMGGTVSKSDRRRFSRLYRAVMRMGPFEEYEAMVAYIRSNETAHFIHFPSIYGARGQHVVSCVKKPDTVLKF